MEIIGFKNTDIQELLKWDECVKAIHHNLGSRVSKTIVHFAIDIKSAMEYVGNSHLDYKNGLIVDPSLEIDISSDYPEEDKEYLTDLVFFRWFCFSSDDVEEISQWIYAYFFEAPSYIWINGKMCGGLCFPQEPGSDDEYPILKEQLSDFVCCNKLERE
jgi:hypothetical protein